MTFVRETFPPLDADHRGVPGGAGLVHRRVRRGGGIGLGIAAIAGGPRSIAARFMIMMVLIAFVG